MKEIRDRNCVLVAVELEPTDGAQAEIPIATPQQVQTFPFYSFMISVKAQALLTTGERIFWAGTIAFSCGRGESAMPDLGQAAILSQHFLGAGTPIRIEPGFRDLGSLSLPVLRVSPQTTSINLQWLNYPF